MYHNIIFNDKIMINILSIFIKLLIFIMIYTSFIIILSCVYHTFIMYFIMKLQKKDQCIHTNAKCKKPDSHTRKQLCTTHVKTACKMKKTTMKKICNSNVAILQQLRIATVQKKSMHKMKHAYKQSCTAETCNMCAKVCQRGLQTPTTWPTSLPNISGKLRVRFFFFLIF